MDLTGKYVKPADLTDDQANILLKMHRHHEFDVNTKIESLVVKHHSSEIDDSSYSDGASCRYDNLMVTVCISNPKVYKIIYRIETCDSEYESEDDEEPITYIEVDMIALWNCEQNILFIEKGKFNTFNALLKKFADKPKIVSKELFYCTLAY